MQQVITGSDFTLTIKRRLFWWSWRLDYRGLSTSNVIAGLAFSAETAKQHADESLEAERLRAID